MKTNLLCALTVLFSVSCTQQRFQNNLSPNTSLKQDVPLSSTSCLVNRPDYSLEVIVDSYEITSSGGLSFGFNLLNQFLKALGASFKTKSGLVTMEMNLYEPFEDSNAIASGKGSGKSSGNEFKANIDAYLFNVSADYYYQTPFAVLTEKGLRNTFVYTLNSLAEVETPWSSTVTSIDSSESVMIAVGSMAGIQQGDQFNMYEIKQHWASQPCASAYLPVKVSELPLAVGSVTQVFKNAAVIKISKYNYQSAITIGTLVEVAKLVPSVEAKIKRKLLKSISIREIKSAKIPIEGGGAVDIGVHAQNQLQSLLREYGFYQKQ